MSFIQRLSPLDVRARRAASVADYYRRYVSSLRPGPTVQLSQQQEVHDLLHRWGIAVAPVPIHVLVHDNPLVESNMPHTVRLDKDYMVLPLASVGDARTLHHEYVHLLQRAYPAAFAAFYLRRWRMRPVAVPPSVRARMRTNPDTSDTYGFIPSSPFGPVGRFIPSGPSGVGPVGPGGVVTQWYRPHPTSLHDSDAVLVQDGALHVLPDTSQYEHPHERIACLVTTFLFAQ